MRIPIASAERIEIKRERDRGREEREKWVTEFRL